MTTYRIEMNVGQEMREVEADFCKINEDGWMIFYRMPPQGGTNEYWRVKIDNIVSMETKRNGERNCYSG